MHGTSAHWGTISDFVQSLTMVLASGEVKKIDRQSAPEEMRAASVAVGSLGVIVELELQAISMPWVAESRSFQRRLTISFFRCPRSCSATGIFGGIGVSAPI